MESKYSLASTAKKASKSTLGIGLSPSFMKRDTVSVPTTDEEAKNLILKSKSAMDWNDKDSPERDGHIHAVLVALKAYADKAQSPFSQQVMSGIESDPKLKPYLSILKTKSGTPT